LAQDTLEEAVVIDEVAGAAKVVDANEYDDVDLGTAVDVLLATADDDVAALVVDVGPDVD
jgi:hypothetical protein